MEVYGLLDIYGEAYAQISLRKLILNDEGRRGLSRKQWRCRTDKLIL